MKRASSLIGSAAGPDDCYLALRGLRTLSVRLARHEQTALTIARWLENRPEVVAVLHLLFHPARVTKSGVATFQAVTAWSPSFSRTCRNEL